MATLTRFLLPWQPWQSVYYHGNGGMVPHWHSNGDMVAVSDLLETRTILMYRSFEHNFYSFGFEWNGDWLHQLIRVYNQYLHLCPYRKLSVKILTASLWNRSVREWRVRHLRQPYRIEQIFWFLIRRKTEEFVMYIEYESFLLHFVSQIINFELHAWFNSPQITWQLTSPYIFITECLGKAQQLHSR